jgi:ubiquinone/menaquinone biosynthesis C-methylase UbiE
MKFAKIHYFGVDISLKHLQLGIKRILPNNLKVQFVRSSANSNVFADNSLDIVFSLAALHHLQLDLVIERLSKALKPTGLLVLCEPSDKNLPAKIGRRLISRDFFTEGEKPISPNQIKLLASKYSLKLIYEHGFDFITTPLGYLIEILKLPKPIAVCSYYIFRAVDYFINSPSLNYCFVEIYKK